MLQVSRPLLGMAVAPLFTLAFPAAAAIAPLSVPAPATVLPENTAYVVLLDMRPETWQQLDQYAFFDLLDAPPTPGGLPFLPGELDYETDIAPWVGDTTALALLPLPRPQATVLEEQEVLVAPIAQGEAFQGFVATVTDLRGSDPTRQVYQDTTILYWEPEFFEEAEVEVPGVAPEKRDKGGRSLLPSWLKARPEAPPEVIVPDAKPEPDMPGLAIAVLPDFLIAATHPAAIRAWIDQRPTDEAQSLAHNPRFHRTLAHPAYDGALGVFYGSMAEMVKYSLTDLALPDLPFDLPFPENLSPQEIAELSALQLDGSIEVLLYPQPEGIRIQGRGYFDDTLLQTVPLEITPAPPQVLATVPDSSYAVLSGHNLAQVWADTTTVLEADEGGREFLAQMRSVFAIATGLDLDEDVFSWMDQGFSIFLFPTQQTPLTLFLPDLHIGLGIALQTSDPEAAANTLSALDQQFGNGFVTVEPQILNARSASSWATDWDWDGQPDSFLGHGWATDDIVVLTTSIGSLSEVLSLSTRRRLPQSPLFRRATQGFPPENQGYFYTNINSTLVLLSQVFPPIPTEGEENNFRQALGTLQTFSGTLSFTEDYLQIDALLMLSRAQRSR